MATTVTNSDFAAPDPTPVEELREHQENFHGFSKLVLFAILHITLILVCLALAFLGHIPMVAVLLGLGGMLALIAGFAISS